MSSEHSATDSTHMKWPTVEILILNWNGRALLELCLPSLVALDYPDFQLALLDNASSDDSVSFARTLYPHIKLLVNRQNLGFSRGMNVGLRQSQADVVVLLNNDVVVRPGWLRALVRPIAENEGVGITGSKLLFPDGQTLQHAGARLQFPLAMSHHHHYGEEDVGQADAIRDVDYVTGASMAISRRVINDVGLLDEGFSPFFYEEADLCYRTRAAGLRILYVPSSVATHHESASIKQLDHFHAYTWLRNRFRFVLKHYSDHQILEAFVPAEIERLRNTSNTQELRAVRQVFLEVALKLPDTLTQFGKSDQADRFLEAAFSIRDVAVARLYDDHVSPGQNLALAESPKRETIRSADLSSGKSIHRGVGAALRISWNEVANKWFIRSLRHPKTALTALLSRLIKQPESNASAHEIGLIARELADTRHELVAQISEIRHELDQLERHMDRVRRLVADEDDVLIQADKKSGKTSAENQSR